MSLLQKTQVDHFPMKACMESEASIRIRCMYRFFCFIELLWVQFEVTRYLVEHFPSS